MTASIPNPAQPGRRCRRSFRALAARGGGRRPGFDGFAPDACLINRYAPGAQLSLHQDKDEQDFAAPIVSVSLGLPAIFLFGGLKRSRQAAPLPAGAWRRRGLGRPVAAVLSRRRAARRRRARPDGPPAHQSDFSKSAVNARFPFPGEGRRLPLKPALVYAPRGRGATMSDQQATSADAGANRTGVYLAVLQLVFTLGWTTYVIYLPKLCAQVGIAPSTVILILMLDQAIFTITDTAMGIAADKIAPFVGRLGVFVGITDRDLLRGLHRAALRGRHRPGRAGLVHRADPDLGRDVVGVARAAADVARQIRARGRRCRFCRRWRCSAMALAGAVSPYLGVRAAQPRSADALRDLRRGAADHGAGAVEGRTRSGAATCRAEQAGRAGKTARPRADVLHRARWSCCRSAINCISASTARRSSCALPSRTICHG